MIHVLRDDPAFVKELDFVMEQDGRLIGQNMFMKTVIEADDGRIIPVPGSISADCGLAWCAKNESEDALLDLMIQHNITPQGIYHCLV